MDGIHDLGGVEGFGPVPVKSGDKDFRDLENWEKRAFALNWSPIAPGSTIDWFRTGSSAWCLPTTLPFPTSKCGAPTIWCGCSTTAR